MGAWPAWEAAASPVSRLSAERWRGGGAFGPVLAGGGQMRRCVLCERDAVLDHLRFALVLLTLSVLTGGIMVAAFSLG